MSTKKTGMARLIELAFFKKGLIICSVISSALSVVVSFIPFVTIYFIVAEVVLSFGNFTTMNLDRITQLGIIAGASAGGAILLNTIALLFSHIAAFETLYKLKLDFTNHIAKLPM